MLKVTWMVAGVLIVLGVGFYVGTGMGHWTSLIPAIVGALVAVFGLVALAPALRKLAMHVAMGVALLLGLASVGMGVPGLVTLIVEGEHPRGAAPVLQTAMGAVLLAYVGLGVRAFFTARPVLYHST